MRKCVTKHKKLVSRVASMQLWVNYNTKAIKPLERRWSRIRHVCDGIYIKKFPYNSIGSHLHIKFYMSSCKGLLVIAIKLAKVKVRLSLCLRKHHAVKTYWGVEV